ncbi:MAG: zinc-dependent alcohol dehydrogenase family protein [Burkholderiales bacterium]|nr:zinc-dependent alcohol dehydrogenase family protein [Burkholderiales bacterium]
MRALRVDQPGGDFVAVDLPLPAAAPGQVVVRVQASGVNPLDTKIRAGQAAHARQPLPAVLGIDMAGIVEQVGPGVTTFAPGDAVYGMAGGIGGLQGTLAERIAVDARLLAHKPARLSPHEAAALPLAVITAWEGLVDRAGVRPGQTVLVQGGAGGVGHVAVQLARARGARVFATVAAEDFDLVRSWGATPVDFRTETVDDYVARHTGGLGFDIVFDAVGGAVLDASFTAVRHHGGHVVSILGWGTHSLAPLSFRAATYSGVFTLLPLLGGEGRERHGAILREAAVLVDAGQLTPRLDPRRFTLADAGEAHALVASGRGQGKVVVDVAARDGSTAPGPKD